MNKHLILIVEDDSSVRNLIKITLRANEYNFVEAQTGETAISCAATQNPDIILLDLGLPDIDGIDVIKRVRSWTLTPIIVISARSDDSDKINALDEGADDYLTKPFSVEELLARIRVAERRLSYINASHSSIFENGGLKIDFSSGCVYLDGNELHLTSTEYKLVCLLAQNVGKVLTHTYITQSVWGCSWNSEIASLRVFMTTLRKKLDSPNKQYIQTHVGIGYRMVKLDSDKSES